MRLSLCTLVLHHAFGGISVGAREAGSRIYTTYYTSTIFGRKNPILICDDNACNVLVSLVCNFQDGRVRLFGSLLSVIDYTMNKASAL